MNQLTFKRMKTFKIYAVIAALALTSGCTRKAEMDRAQRFEQQGRPSQALEIYKAQYAATPEYQNARRADLQNIFGENRQQRRRAAEHRGQRLVGDAHQVHLRLPVLKRAAGSLGVNAQLPGRFCTYLPPPSTRLACRPSAAHRQAFTN